MRLLVIGLLVADALAGGRATARLDSYGDEWVDILVPSVRVTTEQGPVELEGRYAVDAISGATPLLVADVITSATPYAETRHQGGLTVAHAARPERRFEVALDTTGESDFLAQTAGVRWTGDLLDRMATLELGARATVERSGRRGDPTLRSWGLLPQLDVGWRQVLDRRTVASVLLSGMGGWCGKRIGCHANPYRSVLVVDDAGEVAIPERNPDRIVRGAVGLRLARSLGGGTAVHAGWRGYADSWRVLGQTVDLALTTEQLEERLLLRAEGRYTGQGATAFYQDSYSSDGSALPAYRTADRELSGLTSLRAGGRAEWSTWEVGPFLRVGLNLRLARTWYRYPAFTELPRRTAWTAGGGIDVDY